MKRILPPCVASAGLSAGAAFFLAVSSASAQNQARIVGGSEASNGDYPWMTALVEKGVSSQNGQFCGGALIDPNWVVTAAHCAEMITPNNTEVLVGAFDLRDSGSGQRVAITEVRMHSSYRPADSFNITHDIALLRLESPLTNIPLLPLVYSESQIAAGTLSMAIGFGATSENGSGSAVLREVELALVSLATANAHYGNLNSSHLAAGLATGGHDSCFGDSGGPLVVKVEEQWHLAGITSFGDGCGRPGAYGIYANVFHLKSWVENEIQNLGPVPDPGPAPDFNPVPDDNFEFDPGEGEFDPDFEFDPGEGEFDPDFELEPGNGNDDHADGQSGATVVSIPSVTSGNLETAWDYDVFAFELTVPRTVTVETKGSTDTYGYLESESELLAADDSSGEAGNFRITEELEPGTYYVWVEAFDPSSQVGSYQLIVNSDTDTVDLPDIQFYHNDTWIDGQGVIDFGEQAVKGKTHPESLVILNAGDGDLLIASATISGPPTNPFTIATLPADEIAPGRTTIISVKFQPVSAGEFVEALTISSNDPDEPSRRITLKGVGVNPPHKDDHGDDLTTATPLAPGLEHGSLEVGGDIDIFVFELNSAAKVIIRSTGDIDTYGVLMDANGDTIAENDDRGSGFNFRIRRSLAPGTYYLLVEGWDQTITGDYGLTLQVR